MDFLQAPCKRSMSVRHLARPDVLAISWCRADRPELIKVSADAVRIAITHGIAHEAAGEEALDFLRSVLGVRLGQLTLMRGESTRHKLVLVKDLAPAAAFDKLQTQLSKQKAL